MFFCLKRCQLLFLYLLFPTGLAFAVQATGPIPVMSFQQIQQATGVVGSAANIDGPISTYISANGYRYWQIPYNYGGGVYLATTHSAAAGAYEDLLGVGQFQSPQWGLFSNYAQFPGRWWIVSTVQLNVNPVELLSFIHAECLDVACSSAQPQRSGIGVAYFKEGENSNKYRYMGLAIVPYGDPPNFNIQGAPFLIVDGFLQVFYSDASNSSGMAAVGAARVNFADLVSAARTGAASPIWHKYYQGAWSQLGIGGAFTSLGGGAVEGVPAHHIVHSGATYSTYSKKYYLTTYVNADQAPAFSGWPQGNGVFLFDSVDAINWSFKKTLYWAGTTTPSSAPFPSPAHTPGFEYVSITSTDPGAWSYASVGRNFHVYAPFDQGSGASKMSVYRVTVTLESSDCAGDSGNCGAP